MKDRPCTGTPTPRLIPHPTRHRAPDSSLPPNPPGVFPGPVRCSRRATPATGRTEEKSGKPSCGVLAPGPSGADGGGHLTYPDHVSKGGGLNFGVDSPHRFSLVRLGHKRSTHLHGVCLTSGTGSSVSEVLVPED